MDKLSENGGETKTHLVQQEVKDADWSVGMVI
jgi:hypothetical protein